MDLGTSTTTMSKMSDRWRSMRIARRAERLDGENDRLRKALRMTKSQLEHEREHEQDVLDALNRASERKTEVLAKPRGGLLRLILVGGAAYLFGTKAGRDRYEQVRAWSSSMKDRLTEPRDAVDTSSPGIGPKPNPMTESGVRRTDFRGSPMGARRQRSA